MVTGYTYTTYVLAYRLRETVILFLEVLIMGAMLQRWFLLSRRRIADQQEEAKRAEEERVASTENATSPPIDVAAMQQPSIDLKALDLQSRQMLKVVVVVWMTIGLWSIWADVLPALGVLDNYLLWTVEAGDTVREITMRNLMAFLILLGVTVAAVRGLPSVLELLLLNRLPFDFGARYALLTVLRYGMLIGGFVLAFQQLGINWSQYQWLVAAATVGLGFGLQEIFANFVAGLILLAERPIRVGDVVTVENTTGRVSKISMRSTTITNWDRHEYIVPNKDFITGRVLNWTLSNSINRIVINVRIPAASDPELARKVLLGVAADHPLITDDPAPLANLEQFGDGTLNFVLRCYLPDIQNRLSTIHEMHSAIHKALSDTGIPIAAPAQDIRITTADADAVISTAGVGPE
jgi:potassium efflux system protein